MLVDVEWYHYQLRWNEADYNHLNAGIRLKLLCILPVSTVLHGGQIESLWGQWLDIHLSLEPSVHKLHLFQTLQVWNAATFRLDLSSKHQVNPLTFSSPICQSCRLWRKRARPHTACSIFHNLTSAFSFISSHLLRWAHSSHSRPRKSLQRTVKKEEGHKRFALHLSALPFTSFSDVKITHPPLDQHPQNDHVSADCEKRGRPHEAPHHSHLLRLTLSPTSSLALAWAVSQHMTPTRAPRLQQNVVMCWTVMWGLLSPAMILSFLHSSTHLPEIETNPLKMVCVCLYHTWQSNKYFKQRSHMQSSHPAECMHWCTTA